MLAQDRRQALPVHGLGHEIGGAQWDRHAALVENGHHDHRYVTQLGVGLELLERSPAIQLRHHHVERDRLWPVLACERQRLHAVAGRYDAIALLLERLGKQAAHRWIVVHHQHGRAPVCRCRRWRRRPPRQPGQRLDPEA